MMIIIIFYGMDTDGGTLPGCRIHINERTNVAPLN